MWWKCIIHEHDIRYIVIDLLLWEGKGMWSVRDTQETLIVVVIFHFLDWVVVYGCALCYSLHLAYFKRYIVTLHSNIVTLKNKSVCKWLPCRDHKYKYTRQMKTPAALMLSTWIAWVTICRDSIWPLFERWY